MILKYQVTFVTRKVEKKITKNKLILLAREKKMAQNTKKIQKVTRKVEKKITKNKLILLAREKKMAQNTKKIQKVIKIILFWQQVKMLMFPLLLYRYTYLTSEKLGFQTKLFSQKSYRKNSIVHM